MKKTLFKRSVASVMSACLVLTQSVLTSAVLPTVSAVGEKNQITVESFVNVPVTQGDGDVSIWGDYLNGLLTNGFSTSDTKTIDISQFRNILIDKSASVAGGAYSDLLTAIANNTSDFTMTKSGYDYTLTAKVAECRDAFGKKMQDMCNEMVDKALEGSDVTEEQLSGLRHLDFSPLEISGTIVVTLNTANMWSNNEVSATYQLTDQNGVTYALFGADAGKDMFDYASEKLDVVKKIIINGLQSDLQDIADQLYDAKVQINNAQNQINDAETKINDAQKQINDAQSQYDDAKIKLDNNKADYEKAKLEGASDELLAEWQAKIDDAQKQLNAAKEKLDTANAKLTDAKAKLADAKTKLADAKVQLADANAKFEEAGASATKTIVDNFAVYAQKLENAENRVTGIYDTVMDLNNTSSGANLDAALASAAEKFNASAKAQTLVKKLAAQGINFTFPTSLNAVQNNAFLANNFAKGVNVMNDVVSQFDAEVAINFNDVIAALADVYDVTVTVENGNVTIDGFMPETAAEEKAVADFYAGQGLSVVKDYKEVSATFSLLNTATSGKGALNIIRHVETEEIATTTTTTTTTDTADTTTTTSDTTGSEEVTTTTSSTTGSEEVTTTTSSTTGSEGVTTTTSSTTASEAVTTTTSSTTASEAVTTTTSSTTASEAGTTTTSSTTDHETTTTTTSGSSVVTTASTTSTTGINTETSTSSTTTTSKVLKYEIKSDVEGAPGATVQVPVYVYGDTGSNSIVVKFTFDDALSYESRSNGNAYEGAPKWNAAEYIFSWTADENQTAVDGSVLTYLNLTIPANAEVGTVYAVGFDVVGSSTASVDGALEATYTDGSIKVIAPTVQDVTAKITYKLEAPEQTMYWSEDPRPFAYKVTANIDFMLDGAVVYTQENVDITAMTVASAKSAADVVYDKAGNYNIAIATDETKFAPIITAYLPAGYNLDVEGSKLVADKVIDAFEVAIGLRGDATMNGAVDTDDAVLVGKYYAKQILHDETPFASDSLQYYLANCNMGTDDINTDHAVMIGKFYANWILDHNADWTQVKKANDNVPYAEKEEIPED